MDHHIKSTETVHVIGVNYICEFLENAGFEILERHTDPDHHFQLLAKTYRKNMLIAVRTGIYPEIGALDSKGKRQLIQESAQLEAVPHFTGLTLVPQETGDDQGDGPIEGKEYKIIFSGISVVREAE